MTPEELKNQIDMAIQNLMQLSQRVDSLYASNSFPRDVETAIRERINFDVALFKTGTTTAGTQNINLTGNVQTITVPAQPSGAVTVDINGTSYSLLYK